MDYVEWIEKVMIATASAYKGSGATQQIIGLDLRDIAAQLGLGEEVLGLFQDSEYYMPLWNAVDDLESIGLVNRNSRLIKLTNEGNKFPEARIQIAWQGIMDVYLDDLQLRFLRTVVELGQVINEDFANVSRISGEAVLAEMGIAWEGEEVSKGYLLAQQLSDAGLVTQIAFLGGTVQIQPTYVGVVRAARQAETELSRLVRDLVEDWETTNVDFKRELSISRDAAKGEFVRDVLGLVNTKVSGRRLLVIGFVDKTREFHASVSEDISQERLEQILDAYCRPTPRIKFDRVPWSGGEIGLLEIIRDREKVPYRFGKSIGKITEGSLYVRHGSHTVPADEEEIQELLDEAVWAKRDAPGLGN